MENPKVGMTICHKGSPWIIIYIHPHVYMGGQRVPQLLTKFQDFDKWAIAYLSKNSDRLFKKSLSQEQIKDLYKSPITKRGDFPPHLRCKINVSGSAICRCWDIDNNRTQLPDDLKNCDLVPRIHISHMWMMQK